MVHLAQQERRQAPRHRRRLLLFKRCDHGLGTKFAFNCPFCDPGGSAVRAVAAVATAPVDTGEHRTLSPEWRDQILP